MKKLMLIFMFVLLVGTISAAEWDNNLDYENNDMEVKITNWLGLFGWLGLNDEIGTAELKSHTSTNEIKKVGVGQQVVMWYDFDFTELYENGLGTISFININTGKEINRSYSFVRLVDENYNVPVYDRKCGFLLNGTEFCENVFVGEKEEVRKKWVDYNSNEIVKGSSTIGLKVFVNPREKIDAVWTIAGKKVSKHAGFQGTFQFTESKVDSTSAAIYTFSSMNFSIADSSRVIVVGTGGRGTGLKTVVNMTIGGINATRGITEFEGGTPAELYFAEVPTGTSGSVVVTWNGSQARSGIGVWAIYTLNSTPHDSARYVLGTGVAMLDVPKNGVLIGYSYVGSGGDNTWIGATENFDEIVGGIQRQSGALNGSFVNAIDDFNISVDPGTINEDLMVAISWGIGALPPTVTLNSPANNTIFLNNTIVFNITASDSINLTNVSLIVDGQFNGTNSSGLNNSVYLFTRTITDGDHNWTAQACNNEQCANATIRLFTVSKVLIISESFSNTTIEGATESFSLNVTVRTGLQLGITNLVYNDTENQGTVTNPAGQNFTIDRELTIPEVDQDTNITFFWNFSLSDGSFTASSPNNQTVQNLNITDCTTNSILLLNYTLVDEETQSFLNGTAQNTSIEVDVNISNFVTLSSVARFNQTFDKINPAEVCLNIGIPEGIVYRMDTTTRYDSVTRTPEFHHIQNFTLSNSTLAQNITLFDLLSADSTEFLITIKGTDFLPVSDGLIDITRQYVGEGVFKSVEVIKTDEDGQSIGHFDTDAVKYTLIISKEGTIIATFQNVAVICEDATIGDCKINLNALSTGIKFEDWDEVSGLTFITSFDESTREITTTFTTLSGAASTVSSNSTKFDRFGNETVCEDLLTSSSGTLTCTIPSSFGNVTVVQRLFNNDLLIDTKTFTIRQSAGEIFGNTGIILTIILMLTIPFMFISSRIGLLFGGIIGLILSGLLLFMDTGSLLGASSAILWFIIAAGILIWRISRTE